MATAAEDVRSKISVEAHSVIVGEARIAGVNPEAIIREILEQYAEKRIAALKIADAQCRAKGSKGILRES